MSTEWISHAFSGFAVDICGQKLTNKLARNLIYGLVALVLVLLVAWIASIGGGDSPAAQIAATPTSAGQHGGISVVISTRFQLKMGSSHSLTGVSFRRSFGKSFDETLKVRCGIVGKILSSGVSFISSMSPRPHQKTVPIQK